MKEIDEVEEELGIPDTAKSSVGEIGEWEDDLDMRNIQKHEKSG